MLVWTLALLLYVCQWRSVILVYRARGCLWACTLTGAMAFPRGSSTRSRWHATRESGLSCRVSSYHHYTQVGSNGSTTVLDMICLLFQVLRLMTLHGPRWSFRRTNSMKRGPWRTSSSALKEISRSLVYTRVIIM
jgi:hypothetical protein